MPQTMSSQKPSKNQKGRRHHHNRKGKKPAPSEDDTSAGHHSRSVSTPVKKLDGASISMAKQLIQDIKSSPSPQTPQRLNREESDTGALKTAKQLIQDIKSSPLPPKILVRPVADKSDRLPLRAQAEPSPPPAPASAPLKPPPSHGHDSRGQRSYRRNDKVHSVGRDTVADSVVCEAPHSAELDEVMDNAQPTPISVVKEQTVELTVESSEENKNASWGAAVAAFEKKVLGMTNRCAASRNQEKEAEEEEEAKAHVMRRVRVEVCCDSVDSALVAIESGADRLEFCSALEIGGLTPSVGLLSRACHFASKDTVPVHCLIRCRGGDFCYTDDEIDVMLDDVRAASQCGAAGVVFGALTPDAEVDLRNTGKVVDLAHSLSMTVTFHRAFDQCRDMLTSLDRLIALHVDRVLTSGGAATAISGTSMIARCVNKVSLRGAPLVVMAGCGVSKDNVLDIVQSTGVCEVHGSFQEPRPTKMSSENPNVVFSNARLTSREHVNAVMATVGAEDSRFSLRKKNNGQSNHASRKKSYGVVSPVDPLLRDELALFQARDDLVKVRDRELQVLCEAVTKTAEQMGKMDLFGDSECHFLRGELSRLSAQNILLQEDLIAIKKDRHLFAQRTKELEILCSEHEVTRDGSTCDTGVRLDDFLFMVHTQSALRAEIYQLYKHNRQLTSQMAAMKYTIQVAEAARSKLDLSTESKTVESIRRKHEATIAHLKMQQKKLEKKCAHHNKRANDAMRTVRETQSEILALEEKKDAEIEGLAKKVMKYAEVIKNERTMTKYLSQRLDDASLLRHELQKEHDLELSGNKQEIENLKSSVIKGLNEIEKMEQSRIDLEATASTGLGGNDVTDGVNKTLVAALEEARSISKRLLDQVVMASS